MKNDWTLTGSCREKNHKLVNDSRTTRACDVEAIPPQMEEDARRVCMPQHSSQVVGKSAPIVHLSAKHGHTSTML